MKSIAALHDEEADKAWVEKWTMGGDWRVGLIGGLEGDAGTGLGEHASPATVLLSFPGADGRSNHPPFISTSTS